MKQQWKQLAAQIDARTVRERMLLLAAAVAVLGGVAYLLVFGPMWRSYTQFDATIVRQRGELGELGKQIEAKMAAHARDPDVGTRAQLAQVRAERAALTDGLVAMQRGLVPPERMTGLLASLLRANGRAQLVDMTTLPVAPVGQAIPVAPAAPAAAPGAPSVAAAGVPAVLASAASAVADRGPAERGPADRSGAKAAVTADTPLYRHGVRLTLRGSYLDMIDYMAALESLPTQLFWGNAELEVEQYPTVKMRLTLYTLSLDRVWMKL